MAKPISLLYILCAILFFEYDYSTLVLGNKTKGFTVRLIHRDSADPPFYPGNLTHAQTIKLLVYQTKARALLCTIGSSKRRHISNSTVNPKKIRPKTEFQIHGVMMGTFLIDVGIGNFPTRTPEFISAQHHMDLLI